MKISYIDLNYSDHYESYSIKPNRYGGGRVFASWAKELIPNFHIYSTEKSFQDVSHEENKQNCHTIAQDQIDRLQQGYSLKEIIPQTSDSDIILHHFANQHINTDKTQIVWAVGYSEYIHPKIQHLLLYSRNRQKPIISNNTKIYDVVIGTNIDHQFSETKKEDFIFQCSRHNDQFGSEIVAKICLRNKIKAIFAGPIDTGYSLLNHIDNINTFYIGQISEDEKISLFKKARISTFLHSWQTPFNLSAIDALGNGTPIIATNIGFWPDIINSDNGFIIDRNDETAFINAWNNSIHINQKECYNSVYPKFTTKTMIDSFINTIKSIYP